MSESNAELARRGYRAAARGDLEVIAGMLAEDVQWHGGDPSDPAACHNREEALEFMRRAARRPGGIGELVDVVEAGEKVVVIMRPAGSGPGEGQGPTANLTTFRHGKAVEMVHYRNPADALAAAGL
jgi:ketosteroid isomerase-like protein